MSIWSYRQTSNPSASDRPVRWIEQLAFSESCVYCSQPLVQLSDFSRESREPDIRVCNMCGWWSCLAGFQEGGAGWVEFYGNYGVLLDLDLNDIDTPLEEVRRYLLAKFERRFELHPRLLEHAVADLMREFGYEAEVTAYSGDGGIDIILKDGHGTIGVEVKRYKNKIKVEQIRALTGALVLAGQTRGVFLTTSEFEPGAAKAADVARTRGIAVELVDAERFLSALRVGTRPPYVTLEDWKRAVGEPARLDLGGYLAH